MGTSLGAGASNWAGVGVPCYFTATADSIKVNAKDEAWRGSTAPTYTIPPGTREVQVTATPQANTYWKITVSLSVSPDGFITVPPGSSALVTLLSAIDPFGNKGYYANIQVSRFQDVTLAVAGLLKLSPPARTGDVKFHQDMYGPTWPPSIWDLPGVPDAHFLDVTTPVKSGVLNFAKAPSLAIKADNVVLKLAGVEAPQLFAVTWPNSVVRKKDAPPTPFLLFIRQTNSNYVGMDKFEGPQLGAYPDNFDYADIGLFETLHYAANAPRVASAKTADPLQWPYSKGVPYQVAKAGVDVVTVCPCPRYYGDQFKKEYGVLNQTEETGTILQDLQAFMFTQAGIQAPPKSIGNTAIAAFSSGNDILKMWLDPATPKGNFFSNTVRALYFFDPRSDIIDKCIKFAIDWAGKAERDKRIRLYNRIPWPSHKTLLGSAPPSEPFVRNSTDNKRTLSVVTKESWKRTVAKTIGPPSYTWDWGEAHHLIAATMLTHALSQGDF